MTPIDTLPMPRVVEEYEDEDELLADAAIDSDEVPDQYKNWFPDEYITGILGHRGGGKSALLAHYLFNCLAAGVKVFTNLRLYPEKLGITNQPLPLDQDNLLKFDPALERAVLGIEEVGMWYDRHRGMSTTSIIQGKFLQLVVRKQNLRIFYTNQSLLLPGALAEQTDFVAQAFDVFFCDWAMEAKIAKGTTFLYNFQDRTGLGGMVGRQWNMTLRKANKLWNAFDTRQMQDPYLWARKSVIRGNEQIIDLDGDEIKSYDMSEEGLIAWEKDLSAHNVVLSKIEKSYESMGFLDIARKHGAVEECEDRFRFSADRLKTALAFAKGQKKLDGQEAYIELRTLANQGAIARFLPGGIIELGRATNRTKGGTYEDIRETSPAISS